jgi:hypothetical protein
MFNWIKKGLLFGPNVPGYTHASHPCIIHLRDDIFILAFTCRDAKQKSHVFLSYARVKDNAIDIISEPKLALSPGGAGCFDCDGVITGCLVENNGEYYLYYVGWQNLPDGLWLCDTGRAVLDTNSLELQKEFAGPVLGRDKDNPLFAAATAFHITEDKVWHAWYNSGIRWEKTNKGWHHWYGFHHATSSDGIDWKCEPELIFPFADEYEYAFGRPSVVFWDGLFHMWFAHRGTKEISTYRIGYASSVDCLKWDRNDAISGIDVSAEGWDSEMICYPCVFEHEGSRYMLYNGNGYGASGFGLAVLEENK